MIKKLNKTIFFTLLCLWLFNSISQSHGSEANSFSIELEPKSPIDQFYQIVENERQFQLAQQQGLFVEARKRSMEICEQSESQEHYRLDCECFSQSLSQLTDREMYFESVTASQRYEKMMAAAKSGDKQVYLKLKRQMELSETFSQIIMQKCEVKADK